MSCVRLKTMALALEDLEPALWETLTPCLLDLVFLRLPVAQISQLRCLSKLWKAAIDSVESEFNMLSLEDKVYPNLLGLVGRTPYGFMGKKVLYVWMFDVKQHRWYNHEIDHSIDESFKVGAVNGGLVCLVSMKDPKLTIMMVINPLTRKKVELPRLLSISNLLTNEPSMLQLKVNQKNNQYQVFFVGYIQQKSGNKGLIAQVYDSQTKQWSMVGSREKSWGCISGHLYGWSDYNRFITGRLDPCLYDFTQGQLHCFNVKIELGERLRMTYAMLQDRIFILHTKESGDPSNLTSKDPKNKYVISEYHPWQNATSWVKGRTHGCEPFDNYPEDKHDLFLHAWNGYLMVIVRNYGVEDLHVWLYNLSTYRWRKLLNIPKLHLFFCDWEVFMCELRWSAAP